MFNTAESSLFPFLFYIVWIAHHMPAVVFLKSILIAKIVVYNM